MKYTSAALIAALLPCAKGFAPTPLEGTPRKLTSLKDTERPHPVSPVKLVDWFSFPSDVIVFNKDDRPNDDWIIHELNKIDEKTETSSMSAGWFAFEQAIAMDTNDLYTPMPLGEVHPTDRVDGFSFDLTNFADEKLVSHDKVPKASRDLQSQKNRMNTEDPQDCNEWLARRFSAPCKNRKVDIHPSDHLDWFAIASQAAAAGEIQTRTPRPASQVGANHADWFAFANFDDKNLVSHDKVPKASQDLQSQKNRMDTKDSEDFNESIAHRFSAPYKNRKVEIHPSDHLDWFAVASQAAATGESRDLQSQKNRMNTKDPEDFNESIALRFSAPYKNRKVEIHPSAHLDWFAIASQAAAAGEIQTRAPRPASQVGANHADWFAVALFGN